MHTEAPRYLVSWDRAELPLRADTCRWRYDSNENTMPAQTGIGVRTLSAHWQSQSTASANNLHLNSPSITVVVPAEMALITSVSVPSAKPQHIQAAVPNLLEEYLAGDIDDLHIALGSRDTQGNIPVVAVARASMTDLVAQFGELSIDSLVTDAQLLVYTPFAVSVLLHGERALVRCSTTQAGAIEISALSALLRSLWQHGAPTKLLITTTDISDATQQWLQTELSTLEQRFGLTVVQRTQPSDLLAWCAEQIDAAQQNVVNLRQGDFAARVQHSARWQRWRPLAYVAAACLLLQLSLQIASGLLLNHRAETTHAQSAALYRELFPQDKRIVNLRQQMQAHVGGIEDRPQANFWTLFGALTQQLQMFPKDNPPQLRALNYDAAKDVLQVDIVLSSIALIDTLQKQLTAQHVAVKVISANAENGAIVGRLNIGHG